MMPNLSLLKAVVEFLISEFDNIDQSALIFHALAQAGFWLLKVRFSEMKLLTLVTYTGCPPNELVKRMAKLMRKYT
jgi:hypothetical protein